MRYLKHHGPRIITLTAIALLLAGFATGCATRSKLGDLIPAHHLSNERRGEEVWVNIAPSAVPSPAMEAKNFNLQAFAAAPLAAAAVGIAIDYVKGQLQAEAEQYDAQFGHRVFLDTTQLLTGKRANVLITRWVTRTPPKTAEYADAISRIEQIVTSQIAGSTTNMSPKVFRKRIANKSLAFAYCVEVDRDMNAPAGGAPTDNAPFLVRPLFKWQWLTKAKIVSLRSSNPLAWPLGLLLKTGSEVEYDVYFTLDALIKGKEGFAKMSTVGVGDPIQGPEKFNLSGDPHWTEYSLDGGRSFGWIAIPGYPETADQGYLSIQMTVNESDPSNVKKTLLKGAEYLDTNKQSLISKIVGSK